MNCLSFFLLLIVTGHSVNAAKILVVAPVPGYSHYHSCQQLTNILVQNGHNVTLVSYFGKNEPNQKYRDIVLKLDEHVMKNRGKMIQALSKETSIWEQMMAPYTIHKRFLQVIEQTLSAPEFQKLMRSDEAFDLVILEDFNSAALKYIAHKFKVPLIAYSALDLDDRLSIFQGNPDNPSYTSHFQLEYRTEKNFFERFISTIHYLIAKFVLHQLTIPSHNDLLHNYFPEAPHLNDFVYNVSLVFLNADPSVYDAVPRVPSMINIGGFHLAEPKPLPEDLNTILEGAKEGFIYFSLGSTFKGEYLSNEKISMLLRVFSKSNLLVLWKFEKDLSNVPQNVIVRKWLPQNDILAHKNLKLFITQCGIFSMMEAVHYGLPMLAFPMMGDQRANVKRGEAYGYLKGLSMEKLDEKQFSTAIEELITNPSYSLAAKKYSRIMHDKPITPKETVTFWVDYVVRNGGADHLRVASLKLPWYKYFLVDVILFIILSLISIITSLKLLISFIVSKLKLPVEVKKKKE